jgi:O-succinylhomoserine sulfhydrylase
LDIIDLAWLGGFSKKHGILLNVDNCFATPILQKPILFGADLVTHSATKYIDGQGRVMGGIVLGRKDLIKEIYTFCRSTGPALSPFNAWILSKSLETLSLRMEKHADNAMKLAQHFQGHNDLDSLKYPFLPSHPQYEIAKKQMKLGGGVITFQLKGGIERGKRFLNSLQMASLTANLGDTRTICTHPASTTHAKLTEEERVATGITPGLVRVSVGLEAFADIAADIEQAIDQSR